MSDFTKNIKRAKETKNNLKKDQSGLNEKNSNQLDPDASPYENIDKLYKQSIEDYNARNNPQPEDLQKKQYDLRGMGDNRTPAEFAADRYADMYSIKSGDPRPSESTLSPSDIYGTNAKDIAIYLVMALVTIYILRKIINRFR